MSGEGTNDRPRLFGRLKRLFEDESAPQPRIERASRRVELPIPVELRLDGGEPRSLRVRDVSLHGLSVDEVAGIRPGQRATLSFEGYPEVCEPFDIHAVVVRADSEPEPVAGLRIDQEASSAEALQDLRKLVLHYLHHRPLLDRLAKGFSEVRCRDCRWFGRVGERNPVCPRCGGEVRPLTQPPGPA